MIERLCARRRPQNALDLGTGSAVLAIGLAKLERIPVLATDIDPWRSGSPRRMSEANGVAQFRRLRPALRSVSARSAVRERAPFDLIVANILAGPLMSLARDFRRHLALAATWSSPAS